MTRTLASSKANAESTPAEPTRSESATCPTAAFRLPLAVFL